MTWHVEPDVLANYQNGSVDRIAAASIELHVTGCADCRAMIDSDPERFERTWLGIAERVEPSPLSLVERTLASVGVQPSIARLVAVSPALRLSFLAALALVVGFAVGASRSNAGDGSYRLFLVVAPLIPVAGVAFAYGRLVDPAFEFTLTAPIDSFRLLLIRASTVLSISVVLTGVGWLIADTPALVGATAWLVPSLALTLITLYLASRFEMWVSAALTASAWGLAAFVAMDRELEIFTGSAQIVYLILTLLAVVGITARRNSYDRQGGSR